MGRECPLCGEQMRVAVYERVERVPGTTETVTPRVTEWRCPTCDYFEEADERLTES